MKFRKKPVVIDAILWSGKNLEEARSFIQSYIFFSEDFSQLMIQTLEGDMWAFSGDWIIKGVNGEFYPCKPDIFPKIYEKVGE